MTTRGKLLAVLCGVVVLAVLAVFGYLGGAQMSELLVKQPAKVRVECTCRQVE